MAITLKIEEAILGSKGDANKLKNAWNAVHGVTDPMTDDMANQLSKLYPGLNKLTSPTTSGNKSESSGTVVGVIDRLMKTQIRPEAGDTGELQTLQKGLSTFFDEKGKFRGIKGTLKEMGSLLVDEVEMHLQHQNDLLDDINHNTGMVGKLSKEFREEIMAASPAAESLGITFQMLRESVSRIVTDSGKFKLLSQGTIEDMERASIFTEDMKTLAAMGGSFENVGLGVHDMSREIEAAGHRALEVGLNARTTTSLLNKNLEKLNSFGFKEGIKGMDEMVHKSVEFRMSMQNVYNLANKVWSPEGALDVVANLQMIGGAYGDLNDPIKMMYMATNDVEGLQTAIIGAAKSLVTFNSEQGRFQVTGANLRRAKEMADQFGMSLEDLTTTAVAAMERTTAASDLMSTGLVMDPKDREFLTNLAQMKEGKMVIEVPPDLRKQLGVSADNTAIALESMTDEQARTLLEQRDAFKKMSTEDYAREQVSVLQNINRDVSFIRASIRVGIGQVMGEALEEYVGFNRTDITNESKMFRNMGIEHIENIKADILDAIKGSPELSSVIKGKPENIKKENELSADDISNKLAETSKMPSFEEFKKQPLIVEHRFGTSQPWTDMFSRWFRNEPSKAFGSKSFEYTLPDSGYNIH